MALPDVVRREERLPQPLAHEPRAHGRLAVREDAEQRGVLVGLARRRVDRERADRARVEPHELRRVDPLASPLAVRLLSAAGHQLQVPDQPAARAERELVRAVEAAAVQLRRAEQPLQVLLRVLNAERALGRRAARHLAHLHQLAQLRLFGRLQLGGQHALLGTLLAHERLERREVLVVLELRHPDGADGRVDERDADEPAVAGVPLGAGRLAHLHGGDDGRRLRARVVAVEAALLLEGHQVARRAAALQHPRVLVRPVHLDAPALLQQRRAHHLGGHLLVDAQEGAALATGLHRLDARR